MSDTVSRYGIVKSLTDDKISIIQQRASLEHNVKEAKQKSEEAKARLEDWRANIKAENEKQERSLKRDIQEADRHAKNKEEQIKARMTSFELQLKAIDEALARIENISEAAAKEAKA